MRLFVAFILAGCATSTPPKAAADAPSPAGAVGAAPVTDGELGPELVELRLDPGLLTRDPSGLTATFREDGDVQKAAYTVYVLDLASLEAAAGGWPTGPLTLQVAIERVESRTDTPEDPSMPAPMGGFAITTIYGRVLSAAPGAQP